MSQHDLDIANQTFPNTRSDLNNALKALGSTSSGATVPSTTYANQLWYDTANNKLYIRNEDNDANIEICELDQTNDSVEFFKADSIRTALVEYTDGTDAFTISSDGTVAFDTNTLYVDATNNRVGIGTSSPLEALHVEETNADILLKSTSDSGNSRVYFGDPSSSSVGQISYVHADNSLRAIVNGTEKMRIDSSGNVGIGTSSPSTALHVSSTGTPVFRIQDADGSDYYAQISQATGNTIFDARFGASNGAFIFRGLGGGVADEYMRIDSSGNVGIGNTNPQELVHLQKTGGSTIRFQNTGTRVWSIGNDSTSFVFDDVTAGTERMRIDSSGNVLIGTTSTLSTTVGIKFTNPSTIPALILAGTASTNANSGYHMYSTGASAFRFYVGYGGLINATTTSINAISDESLKENIRDLDTGLNEIMQLKPRRFDWKEETQLDQKNIAGFIAQEVETVLPDLVYEYQYTKDETKKSLKMGDMLPTAIKAIQELKAENDTLKSQLSALETRITALENK